MSFATIKLPDGTEYQQPLGLFINNEYVDSHGAETLVSYDPSTGKELCKVQCADPKIDVDLAVKAAREAFPVWRDTPAIEKRDLFYKLAELIERDVDIISKVESLDTGKPLAENATGDVLGVAQVLKYYAGWIDKAGGKTFTPTSKQMTYTLHQPLGVVGCIIPFNYPLGMMAWKWTAIATGNTAVFKSADQTPLSILFFAKLVKEAGFPSGVFNVLSGTGVSVGSAIVKHLGVDKIAFTGSTAVGQIVQQQSAINLKPITLECGGKSANMIFEDCDLDQAVKWSAVGLFSNMGQICSATSRVYVQESIYEEFIAKLAKHVESEYKVGSPSDPDTVVGPQVSKKQQERVLEYIKIGIDEGCRVALGGLGVPEAVKQNSKLSNGYYVKPTIFADVKPSYRLAKEEVFGPVIVVGTFKDYEEAIKIANDSDYGLGSAVFSQNVGTCHKFARDVEAGIVWINSSNDVDLNAPFGGVKMSGHGRELGEYGLANFTNVKSVYLNLGMNL